MSSLIYGIVIKINNKESPVLFMANLTLTHIKPIQSTHQPEYKMVSIIIPAHNEQNYIEATLKSIKSQNYKGYLEILVITNGCSDKTANTARQYTDKVFEVAEANLSLARNLGANKASGDVLIFLDADTQLSPLVVGDIVNYLEYSSNYTVGLCEVYPDINELKARIFLKIKNLIHRLGFYFSGAGIIFCSKKLFQDVGGFDKKLHIFEHSDFFRRAIKKGYHTGYLSTPVITSMRRYQSMGYLSVFIFWLRSLSRLIFRLPLGKQVDIQ